MILPLFFVIFVKLEPKISSNLKKKDTGRRGEELALAWLQERGFRLLDRNWRSGHKELDLVMESAEHVHIVEVKTLTAPLLIQPFEKVDAAKQTRMVAAASNYIAARQVRKEVQFDVISVVLDGDQVEIEYIPEAFFPIWKR